MANKTIPQLPNAAAALLAMLLEVDNAGTSQNISITQLQTLLFAGGALLPSGTILMWHGSIATIPAGFFFCNGANGTPDLRNRMIAGAQQDTAGVAQTFIAGVLQTSGGSNVSVSTCSFANVIQADNNGVNSVDVADGDAGIVNPVFGVVNPFYALAFIMKS